MKQLKLAQALEGRTLHLRAPTSGDVYSIAKDYVKPTLKATNIDFADSGYQFGQMPDSVYVIKSYVETSNGSGENQRTNFEITLKFKGGAKDEDKNWEVLNLNEQ